MKSNIKITIIVVLLILAFIFLAFYNGWMVYEGFVAMNPELYKLPDDLDTPYDIPKTNNKPDLKKIPLAKDTDYPMFPYKPIQLYDENDNPLPLSASTQYKRSMPANMYKLYSTQAAILPTGDNVVPAPLNASKEVIYDLVPNGYYVVDYNDTSTSPATTKKMIARVPSGFVSYDKKNITPITTTAKYSAESKQNDVITDIYGTNASRYTLDNLDVTYHDSPENIAKTDVFADVSFGMMKIMGPDGTLIDYPFVGKTPLPTYYQPGSFQLGAATYVPNYESSVYLSRLTEDGIAGQLYNKEGKVYESASSKAGFCNTYDIDKQGVEEKCGALDVNACASTSCCVLLGGSKCVAGNASGPAMRANYSDPFIRDKDFYYYSGKCYGNCT